MLDNSNTLTISSTLTKIGKKRLTEGKFKISKVAVGDDGVNYTLIDQNISDDDLFIRRTPLFDVWKDGHMGIKNKIRLINSSGILPNNRKMDYSISRNTDVVVSISGDERKFPVDNREEGNTVLTYYGKNGNDLSNKSEVKISFNHDNIFGSADDRFITATLYDSSYFDIAVAPENISKYTNVDLDMPNFREDVMHNSRMEGFLQTNLDVGDPIYNGNALDRNFNTAYFILDDDQNTPKTINILSSGGQTDRNSFVLYYKGNFDYKNPSVENYKTILELFDENSGITEYIQLSIVPITE